jgi:hypothetical protein
MESLPLTIKRQHELVTINRVLAILVVVLAFSTGFLLSIQGSWFVQYSSRFETEAVHAATQSATISSPISPLTALLHNARYERAITPDPISSIQLSSLVWSGQGTITNWGERTVPSFKSAFPFSLYALVRKVDGLSPGFYLFQPKTSQLIPQTTSPAFHLPEMMPSIMDAPVVLFLVGPQQMVVEGMVWNEAGGIAQNVLLAAIENHLSAFLLPNTYLPKEDASFFPQAQTVFWFMPIGHPKDTNYSVQGK